MFGNIFGDSFSVVVQWDDIRNLSTLLASQPILRQSEVLSRNISNQSAGWSSVIPTDEISP